LGKAKEKKAAKSQFSAANRKDIGKAKRKGQPPWTGQDDLKRKDEL